MAVRRASARLSATVATSAKNLESSSLTAEIPTQPAGTNNRTNDSEHHQIDPQSAHTSSPLTSVSSPVSNKATLTKVKKKEEKTAVVGSTSPAKTKKKKQGAEPDPTEYSRVENDWKLGAHISAAGGVENAIINAAEVGANAFALFLKSQRKWTSPNLSETSIKLFKSRMSAFGYESRQVLPHGSYLINLGNPDKEKRQKSYDCFLDDLKRCEQLGLELYNFHPGSTVGSATVDESISFIAECLNKAHKETSSVITVIENMAGSGNIVGSKFAQLASIIRQVEDKRRVGVCLDTCHMFAAGYDIRTKETYEKTMEEFDREVGLSYLRGMHINDSKTGLGSNKDRHENIGQGFLGIDPFTFIIRDPRLKNIPLILETPSSEDPNVWKKEIEMLNSISLAEVTNSPDELDEKKKLACAEIKKAVEASSAGSKKKVKVDKKRKADGGNSKKTNKRRKTKDEEDEEEDDSYDET